MIVRYHLPTGCRIHARRKTRGTDSLAVDLMLHDERGDWAACLGEARWSPRDRRLVVQGGAQEVAEVRAAIGQHGIADVDAVVQAIGELVGFPRKEAAA